MNAIFRDYYESPIGLIEIIAEGNYLVSVSFCSTKGIVSSNLLTRKACFQLAEYFEGKRTNFDLPYHLQGTSFQQEVWKTLIEISYGTTKTYSDIAKLLNREKAVRAVAGAIGKNPLLIIIPCHRVIGKNSTLTGYKAGLDKKRYLLDLEYPQ